MYLDALRRWRRKAIENACRCESEAMLSQRRGEGFYPREASSSQACHISEKTSRGMLLLKFLFVGFLIGLLGGLILMAEKADHISCDVI